MLVGGEAAFSVCRLDVSQRRWVACYVERERKKKGCGKYASFHKFAKLSVLFSVTSHLAPLGKRECCRSMLDTVVDTLLYCVSVMWVVLKVRYK
jgi:hypothetical protein